MYRTHLSGHNCTVVPPTVPCSRILTRIILTWFRMSVLRRCRYCLEPVKPGGSYVFINHVGSFSGWIHMTYLDMSLAPYSGALIICPVVCSLSETYEVHYA